MGTRSAKRIGTFFGALTLAISAREVATCAEPALEPGFDHFYNLEYNEALKAFKAEAAQDPNSPDPPNHIAQTLLYREMFRSGALESELVTGTNPFLRRPKMNISAEDDREFHESINRAIQLARARIASNARDAHAYYALGVSYGLRANYGFLVRKAYMDALHDSSDARAAHKQATDIDPSLVDAQLVQGVYDYLVGSLPWHLKLLGFLAGYHGDRTRGIHTLQLVAEKGRLNRFDAQVILCAIYRRERRPGDAVPLLKQLIQQFSRNYLLRFELVQMYGDLGEKEQALAVIRQIDELRKSKAPGFANLSEEKIRYTRGNLLFWYNDLDEAVEDLKAVTAKADSLDLNTGVYAWLRLGQTYDLKGERSEAIAAYNETIAYAPGSDAANEAKNYLSNRYQR